MQQRISVSPSEVNTYNRCETAHRFGYGHELSPLNVSDPLQIGLCFHEGAAEFYSSLNKFRAGELDDIEDCRWLANLQMERSLADFRYWEENVLAAKDAFNKYLDIIDTLEWEVLAVEDYVEYPVSDEINLHGVIDLAVRIKRAPADKKYLEGKVVLVDHKTCYNFFTYAELRLHAQLPKYVFIANKTMRYGEKVHGAIVNQIRWRHDARDKVRRSYIDGEDLTYEKQVNLVNEHVKTANRILERRHLPLSQWKDKATRVIDNKDICGKCDFADLCELEVNGASPNRMRTEIETYYQRKDLSYRETRKAS